MSISELMYIANYLPKKEEQPSDQESGSSNCFFTQLVTQSHQLSKVSGLLRLYKLSKLYRRRGPSSWYGKTVHEVCRYVHTCVRQNSRVVPVTG